MKSQQFPKKKKTSQSKNVPSKSKSCHNLNSIIQKSQNPILMNIYQRMKGEMIIALKRKWEAFYQTN
jgi:hypothetical protein